MPKQEFITEAAKPVKRTQYVCTKFKIICGQIPVSLKSPEAEISKGKYLYRSLKKNPVRMFNG